MRYLFLILWVICLPCVAIDLPDIGISANTIMSPADEQKLGETFIRQLRRQVEVIDDLQISNYLNALGHRLASYSDNPEQRFRFFTIKESSINAFAVPGGFIGVHSGLILKTQSESELASVLSHEIAHVTQRHIARTIEGSQRFSLPAIAALIAAAVLAGAAGSPEVGEAALASILAGNIQMQINFTRIHEKEADRVGMQILAKAGFNPNDMPNFFERLQTASRYYEDWGVPEFLRTHPVTTDRIAEARDRAEKYSKKLKSDTPPYHLMKAQLVVLVADNKQNLLKRLKKMLKTGHYRDESAIRYALALTLLATRQTDGVQTQIDWLLKNDNDRVIYRLLKARLASLQKNDTKAMQIYKQALEVYPDDNMLVLDYAEKLLQNNAAQKAKAALLTISPASNPNYYHLLAKSYQLTGVKGEAHLALAESYYLMGQTGMAVEQLKLARQIKQLDFYLASRIEARYQVLQKELFEEQR
ncbi:M48 family metalloprotease [Candidatus Parabeggiatoa sp. HSG14]|uniref:M48 family metallopeptidase n=1 Tax=Candidatus Parabeggiatoa sp. HSG14 TaxID=3055593 RepID=UPI0025A7AB03|nr:M48 family metalloprotease [Thiotrichales bacterium HSG14]